MGHGKRCVSVPTSQPHISAHDRELMMVSFGIASVGFESAVQGTFAIMKNESVKGSLKRFFKSGK